MMPLRELRESKRWDVWLRVGIFLALSSYALNCIGTTVADPDLWGFLAFGRLFWNSNQFPYQDVFSYVPTLNFWVYHEWLTGVLFYPIYQALGAPGLQVFKYVVGLGTFALIYLTARKRGAHPLSALFMLFLVVAGLKVKFSPVRAQVFSLFFFALTLFLLETVRLKQKWRFLWLIIPVQIFWCNLHGGFVAGLGLLFLYAVGEAFSRRPFWPYLGSLLLSGLATLVNPYGLDYWYYLLHAIPMPRPGIREWMSIHQHIQAGLYGPVFYVSLILILSAFFIWRSRWRETTAGLALVFTLISGLHHIRHFSFFLILLGAYLPVALRYYQEDLSSRPWLMNALKKPSIRATILTILLVVSTLFTATFISTSPLSLKTPAEPKVQAIEYMYYPIGAVEYIEQHGLAGKVLIFFNWGEYFLWRLYPQCRVAIDGRYETVYPEDVARDYFDFISAQPNWKVFLDKYPPDMILIETDSDICKRLASEPGWRKVYADPGCALFLRW